VHPSARYQVFAGLVTPVAPVPQILPGPYMARSQTTSPVALTLVETS